MGTIWLRVLPLAALTLRIGVGIGLSTLWVVISAYCSVALLTASDVRDPLCGSQNAGVILSGFAPAGIPFHSPSSTCAPSTCARSRSAEGMGEGKIELHLFDRGSTLKDSLNRDLLSRGNFTATVHASIHLQLHCFGTELLRTEIRVHRIEDRGTRARRNVRRDTHHLGVLSQDEHS